MESRIQGPLNNNSSFFSNHLEVSSLEQVFVDEERLRLEEEEQQLLMISSLENNMPFLQMLQTVETPQFFPFKEPTFQTLLRLQNLKKQQPFEGTAYRIENQILELESCITNDPNLEMIIEQSPVKSETINNEAKRCRFEKKVKNFEGNKERRKRRRTRPTKNKEDVENQRMTHIAVERNRRRQMNDHLGVLRSLMPPSYIQRGDQASIIGGAIDFVKELEQLLESLEAQKKLKKNIEEDASSSSISSIMLSKASSSSSPPIVEETMNCGGDELKAENKSEAADIKVTLIQNHVNLKIECKKKPGQLIKVIVALEELRLTILHLNITSYENSVLYSLNLKIEEDCKLGSANDIAEAVHQIFNFINGI